MAHYLFRWQFSLPSVKGLVGRPQDRTAAARELIESFGGKMQCYYFALGEFDGYAVAEFANTGAAAAASLAAASSGAFTRFETVALMTAQEAEAAMKVANAKAAGYRPPNA